jgi:hypothetical protein
MKNMNRIKQIIILLVFVQQITFAGTIVVDQSGNGDYATIGAAISAAANNDTIQIKAGTYLEAIENSKSLTLIGSGMGSTIIYSGSDGTFSHQSGSLTLIGIKIQSTGKYAFIIQTGSATIIHCEFETKKSDSGGFNSYVGLWAYSNTDLTVYNSVFKNNGSGIYHSGSGGTHKVYNSIFYNNATGFYNHSSATSEIYNSIFYSNKYGLYASGTVLHVYNCYFDNSSSDIANGSLALGENTNINPQFVNAPTSWAIKTSSELIDAGNPAAINNDPDGSRNDIGIYGGPKSISLGPAITALSISSSSVEQGTAVTITGTAKSK